MAHQLEITGPNYGMGLCQVGSITFDRIRSWFKPKDTHILIHSTLGGYIDSSRSSRPDVANTAEQNLEKMATELLSRIESLSPDETTQLLKAYQSLDQK